MSCEAVARFERLEVEKGKEETPHAVRWFTDSSARHTSSSGNESTCLDSLDDAPLLHLYQTIRDRWVVLTEMKVAIFPL